MTVVSDTNEDGVIWLKCPRCEGILPHMEESEATASEASTATTLDDIDIDSAQPYDPSQVYETLLAVLILGLVWTDEKERPPGVVFLRFAALTTGARLFLEAFRGDSVLVFGGLRLAQLAAWGVLVLSLTGLTRLTRRESKESEES